MLYAISDEGVKVGAIPGASAFCPECGAIVLSKCGQINIWHWAHESRNECNLWGEHETEWHLRWKHRFALESVEVVIERNGVKHRADILTNRGMVIELQHSPISPDEIEEREAFYGNMAWVFDVEKPYSDERLLFYEKSEYYTFLWKNARKHIASAKKDTYLDIGRSRLFNLKRMYRRGGWGKFVDLRWFLSKHGGQKEQTQ